MPVELPKLLEQSAEHLARKVGQVILRILQDPGRLAAQSRHALGHHAAELAQETADLVHLSDATGHRERAGPVHHQYRQLLLALDRHEAHVRSPDGLADRVGVLGIVLAPLAVGRDVLRRHQRHRMPSLVSSRAQ